MKRRKNSRGFTLIELLVVIAIIGVLASIVLASLNSARRKSRDARRITDIKQIQLALELYYDSQSPTPQYPPAVAPASGCDPATGKFNGLEALSSGGYIPQVPRDPNATGTDACYKYTSNSTGTRTTYHLGATLEEGTNPALNSDKDCNSGIAASPAGTANICVAQTSYGPLGTPFDGTQSGAPLVYDVIP